MNEIAKKNDTESICDIESQMDLLKLFKLPPTSIETHWVKKIVIDGKERMCLCKRERPIKVFENDSGRLCTIRGTKTNSERIGMSNKRGKYNDEDRLIGSEAHSVEAKEVQSFDDSM